MNSRIPCRPTILACLLLAVLCGCKPPRVDSSNAKERLRAVKALGSTSADQAILAKLAVEDQDSDVRLWATTVLHDEALLVKVAYETDDLWAHDTAVREIVRQGRLLQGVTGTEDFSDQMAIIESNGVRLNGSYAADPIALAEAVAGLSETDPALKVMAGFMGGPAANTRQAIARIKLALIDPVIRSRLPRAEFRLSISGNSAGYSGLASAASGNARGGSIRGESVLFMIGQDGHILAREGWNSSFPEIVGSLSGFCGAKVVAGKFLAQLLRQPEFKREDLAGLSKSRIPEVREGAAVNSRR